MDILEASSMLFADPDSALKTILRDQKLENIYLFNGSFRIVRDPLNNFSKRIEQLVQSDLIELPWDVAYYPAGFVMGEDELQSLLKPHGLTIRKNTTPLYIVERRLRYVKNDFARKYIKDLALIDNCVERRKKTEFYLSKSS